MPKPIGKLLNQRLGTEASHALYREDGRFYEHLERFPGILFDRNGYLLVETKHAYESFPQLHRGKKLNVAGGISRVPGYLYDRRIEAILSNL
jgi:5-methylcytosine-specific restriction protein A